MRWPDSITNQAAAGLESLPDQPYVRASKQGGRLMSGHAPRNPVPRLQRPAVSKPSFYGTEEIKLGSVAAFQSCLA